MPPVMILTDSTAYLPQALVEAHPIRVVPLMLHWDGENYRDGVDITARQVYTRMLTAKTIPTTSQVPLGIMEKELTTLVGEGYDVLVLPISSGISSTYQTAESVIATLPAGRVRLVETGLVSMALGFQVLAASRLAQTGASLEECEQAARQAYDQIGVYFTVETLKYLAAGGRINTAKKLLGSALAIKPVLTLSGGKIDLVTSVRTQRKAVEAMLDLVEKGIAGRQPVRISVFHALADELAAQLMETVQQRFAPIECILAEVSPVIGAHVGPGTVAVAFHAGG